MRASIWRLLSLPLSSSPWPGSSSRFCTCASPCGCFLLRRLAIGGTGISPLIPSHHHTPVGLSSAADQLPMPYFTIRASSAGLKHRWPPMPGARFSAMRRHARSCCPSRRSAINTRSAAITQCCRASCSSSWHSPFSSHIRWHRTKIRARLDFVLGLTVPVTVCVNAWILPLHAVLVSAWKVVGATRLGPVGFAVSGNRDRRRRASFASVSRRAWGRYRPYGAPAGPRSAARPACPVPHRVLAADRAGVCRTACRTGEAADRLPGRCVSRSLGLQRTVQCLRRRLHRGVCSVSILP